MPTYLIRSRRRRGSRSSVYASGPMPFSTSDHVTGVAIGKPSRARGNWLSNRVFASYTDLVDHCCVAWNKLIERPWTIMSIGLRDWANGF